MAMCSPFREFVVSYSENMIVRRILVNKVIGLAASKVLAVPNGAVNLHQAPSASASLLNGACQFFGARILILPKGDNI
jgi:hypothetical protein